MSETEHYKGKIIPVVMTGDLEATAKRILENNNIELLSTYSYLDQLFDAYWKRYVVIKDQLFRIEAAEVDPYDEILEATKNSDGTFDFNVRYYNGCLCLPEAIDYAVGKLENAK